MCNSRNTTITTIITITISGGDIGITITTTIITTITIATIDGRDDAEIGRGPSWGPVLFWKLASARRDRELLLAGFFLGRAMKMPIGAIEHGVR